MTHGAEGCPAAPGQWFAIRTRPRHELVVANRLAAEDIQTFWPTYRESVRWTDREQVAIRSLFPGYLFGYFETPVYVPGTLQILNEPVDSGQIESIRRAIDANAAVSPCAYVTGETVRIRRGPLEGCEGTIERLKNGGRRLIVRVEILHRAVAIELDSAVLGR